MFREPELPDKLYFKIGEVSTITELPAYVLRFWESEFSQINPRRTDSGQRLYRPKDVTLILKIKHLLYEKKFTIQGARQHLGSRSRPQKDALPPRLSLAQIKAELHKIRRCLE
jgi:DNA-binding transcriptional MerR regulator